MNPRAMHKKYGSRRLGRRVETRHLGQVHGLGAEVGCLLLHAAARVRRLLRAVAQLRQLRIEVRIALPR